MLITSCSRIAVVAFCAQKLETIVYRYQQILRDLQDKAACFGRSGTLRDAVKLPLIRRLRNLLPNRACVLGSERAFGSSEASRAMVVVSQNRMVEKGLGERSGRAGGAERHWDCCATSGYLALACDSRAKRNHPHLSVYLLRPNSPGTSIRLISVVMRIRLTRRVVPPSMEMRGDHLETYSVGPVMLDGMVAIGAQYGV